MMMPILKGVELYSAKGMIVGRRFNVSQIPCQVCGEIPPVLVRKREGREINLSEVFCTPFCVDKKNPQNYLPETEA